MIIRNLPTFSVGLHAGGGAHCASEQTVAGHGQADNPWEKDEKIHIYDNNREANNMKQGELLIDKFTENVQPLSALQMTTCAFILGVPTIKL